MFDVLESCEDSTESSFLPPHLVSPMNADITVYICHNQETPHVRYYSVPSRLYLDFTGVSTDVLFLFQDPSRVPCCVLCFEFRVSAPGLPPEHKVSQQPIVCSITWLDLCQSET